MKNSADLGGCYPPRPSASVDNTLLYLQNSSYPTQPHSIIANYCTSTVSQNTQYISFFISRSGKWKLFGRSNIEMYYDLSSKVVNLC